MADSKTRDAILVRRGKFVAAALACAGLSSAAAATTAGCCPQTCLEPAMDDAAGQPCLSIAEPFPSATAPEAPEAAPPTPSVCLAPPAPDERE